MHLGCIANGDESVQKTGQDAEFARASLRFALAGMNRETANLKKERLWKSGVSHQHVGADPRVCPNNNEPLAHTQRSDTGVCPYHMEHASRAKGACNLITRSIALYPTEHSFIHKGA